MDSFDEFCQFSSLLIPLQVLFDGFLESMAARYEVGVLYILVLATSTGLVRSSGYSSSSHKAHPSPTIPAP